MTHIRSVSGDQRLSTAFTLYPYAFDATPAPDGKDLRALLPYHSGNHTLVVEDGADTLATAAAIPMRQNLRTVVMPMAGIAWVATRPGARRQGHGSRVLRHLHADMREQGHRLATLYPSHPSFYERHGYLSLPLRRTVTFPPEGLASLLRARLPGTVSWQNIRDGFDVYRAFQRQVLTQRHGFCYTPDYRAARMVDAADRWLAIATLDGEVVGTLTYRIDDFGGRLDADELLYTHPAGRALLLQFLAEHAYQVSHVSLTVTADELPETWATGLSARVEAEVSFPNGAAMMGRLLTVDALQGVECGAGQVEIRLVDDADLAGCYLLDGSSGTLDVTPGRESRAEATLTTAGLSGLAYGVLDPVDVAARGLGEVSDKAAAALRSLLPRRLPYAIGVG
ncbi:hypothetical protein AWW66_08335 [Micromonospora rosaria]|uniref:N-acetyltransferase domain-containing protein n=1 Tax=Micromonospora rosaria TaxID=47874 RepID=A0A136PVK7_9ACTN|nr:GNAT family N-acetyltransferase [Micromonospora rosaria]KXK62442.1 hypothetical protein AWW66_08335 [Micromonospora rosaria]